MFVCLSVNCPVDNIKLSVVVSNLAVAEQIGELSVHCRFGVEPILPNRNSSNDCTEQYQVNPHGCPVTMRASAIRCWKSLVYNSSTCTLLIQFWFSLFLPNRDKRLKRYFLVIDNLAKLCRLFYIDGHHSITVGFFFCWPKFCAC